MEKSDIDTKKEKTEFFQRCYDGINQGMGVAVAAALSMAGIDHSGLKEFFGFCYDQDKKNGKETNATSIKLAETISNFKNEEIKMPRARVKITSIPPGEAPEKIRKEWIGVIIPLSEFQPTQDELVRSTKGISGDMTPPKRQVVGGFVVDIIDAIEALDKSGKKKAANWWRKWVEVNLPKTFGQQLVFAKSCGELVDD